MTDPTLFVVGTPRGYWATWAPALLGPVADDGAEISTDALALSAFDAPMQRSAQYLVFVESPAIGLAAALAAGQTDNPLQWLDEWRAGAQRLLRIAQGAPTRCLLVDADEARRYPHLFAQASAARFDLELSAPAEPIPAARTDPLSQALGDTLAFADRDVQALFTELLASCALLCADEPALGTAGNWLQIDGKAAAGRLNELHALEQAASEAAEVLAVLSARADSQASALEQREEQLASAQSRLQETVSELNAVQQVGKSLQQQIVSLSQVHAQHERQLQDAQTKVATLLAQERNLTEARDRALAGGRQIGTELDTARRELQEARQESELLLLQLHQVQEELEHYYLKCRNLEQAAQETVPAAGMPGLRIAEVLPAAERDTPPHRELTFVLRHVKVAAREIPEATVRLVEHHGHPGLVVFAVAEGPQLLDTWRETGREDDRPYMLLLPSDAQSTPIFAAMGSNDWLLTQALVARLEQQLQDASAPLAPHWRHLGRRLREQLQEMPRRFRYGRLDVEAASGTEAGAGTLAFRFGQVNWGARHLDRLTLHWQPAGPRAGLHLLCDADAGPPLPSWPCDERGELPKVLWLPLGADVSEDTKRQQWKRLPLADYNFVLALLAAMPGAASHVPPTLLGSGIAARPLAAAAEAMLREAQQAMLLLRAPPAANLLQRIARRLRDGPVRAA